MIKDNLKKEKKLVMTLLVRDEIDIIDKNIEFHLDRGVDFIIATDNGSVDGTRDVLKKYEKAGSLLLIDEKEQNYAQAEWVNRMGKIAFEKYGADIIFHCDADEFWSPISGNLKNEILDSEEDYLKVNLINVILNDRDGAESFPRDSRYAVVDPFETKNYEEDSIDTNLYLFEYPSKVIFKTMRGNLEVTQGNHSIINEGLKNKFSNDIKIFHFPIRSKEHFFQKVINGGSSYEKNKYLGKEIGFQWRRWFDDYKKGTLDSTYKKLIFKKDEAAKLIKEGRIKGILFDEIVNNHGEMVKTQIIQQKDQEIIEKSRIIHQKEQEIIEKSRIIQQKDQELAEKDRIIHLEKDQIIQQKDQELAKKDQIIQQKDQELAKKDQIIQQKDQEIKEKNQEIISKKQEIQLMKSSKFWKLKKCYEKVRFLFLHPLKFFSKNKNRIYFAIFHPIRFFSKYLRFFSLKVKRNEVENFIKQDYVSNKKTIVFVDCNVPTYDKDAGSRTIHQYMKLFLEMDFNVVFMPDNFDPIQPYTKELEELGVKVLYGSRYFRNWSKWFIDNKENIDYFFLCRASISFKYLEFIKDNLQAKIIYYPVDITYIRETRQYEITKEKHLLEEIDHHKEIEFFMFKNSDVVITISEYEKSVIKKEFPKTKVFIIPTFIYDCSFPMIKGKSFDERRGLLFVGGFLHLPNVDGIKWFVNKVFPIIKKEIPDIQVNIIGSNAPREINNFASENIKILGFVSDEKLEQDYSKTRVVIAPLRYGAGVKGKIIESIAYGLPVVTTEIGAEGIANKKDVLLVGNNEGDFAKMVIKLYNNRNLWKSLRNCQIKYAKSFLSKEGAKKIFKEILNEISKK